MSKNNTAHSLLTVVLLAIVVAVGYLWMTGQLVPRAQVAADNATAGGSSLPKTEAEFRNKLVEFRMQRDKVQRGVERLENLKRETLDHLKEKGIHSGDDFLNSEDSDVKYAMINLKEWVSQIEKTSKEVTYYDEAISSIKVMLDRIERERINEEVGLSDEEYMDLQKVIVDLNERLKVDTDPIQDEELSKLLDSEILRED